MAKKASEILARAAEYVLSGEVAGCSAIARAFGNDRQIKAKQRASKYYASLFRNDSAYWFGSPYNELNQKHRATALLMTATMAESVGD